MVLEAEGGSVRRGPVALSHSQGGAPTTLRVLTLLGAVAAVALLELQRRVSALPSLARAVSDAVGWVILRSGGESQRLFLGAAREPSLVKLAV